MSRPANPTTARSKSVAAVAACVALACALSGCMVGPNYVRPQVPQPSRFKSEPTTPPTTSPAAAEVPAQWWKLYADPELDRLVDTADAANQDLRQAMARADQSRALARVAGSFLAPTVALDPSFTRTRTSGDRPSSVTGQPLGSIRTSTWSIPFDLTYEIDVWGRVRRSFESATAQAQASTFDEAVVRLNILASVAQSYYQIRSLDAQKQI